MSIIPNDKKIYFCEDGGCCFTCVGKENCNNYRIGSSLDKFAKLIKNKGTVDSSK